MNRIDLDGRTAVVTGGAAVAQTVAARSNRDASPASRDAAAAGTRPTRRQFLTGLGAAMIAGCEAAPSSSPNILLFVTDDQRADMFGEGGNRLIGTPNIDRLAREGVLFENNFVTTSYCPASRASLFTGLYARCHGVGGGASSPFDDRMLAYGYPGRLRQSGYYTGFIGKFGFADKHIQDISSHFDWFRGYPGQGDYLLPDGGHLTEHLGGQALEFLDTTERNRPWNLSLSFKAPHVQDGVSPWFIADSRYDDLYDGVELPGFRHMDGRYYDSLPDFLRKETESRIRWERRFGSPELWERSVKGYFALIHGVDVQIGRILEKIESMGQMDDTVVIFTSDNGFFLGERGWAGKWYPHEESIRTPMIVCPPPLPPGLQFAPNGNDPEYRPVPDRIEYGGRAGSAVHERSGFIPAHTRRKPELAAGMVLRALAGAPEDPEKRGHSPRQVEVLCVPRCRSGVRRDVRSAGGSA